MLNGRPFGNGCLRLGIGGGPLYQTSTAIDPTSMPAVVPDVPLPACPPGGPNRPSEIIRLAASDEEHHVPDHLGSRNGGGNAIDTERPARQRVARWSRLRSPSRARPAGRVHGVRDITTVRRNRDAGDRCRSTQSGCPTSSRTGSRSPTRPRRGGERRVAVVDHPSAIVAWSAPRHVHAAPRPQVRQHRGAAL